MQLTQRRRAALPEATAAAPSGAETLIPAVTAGRSSTSFVAASTVAPSSFVGSVKAGDAVPPVKPRTSNGSIDEAAKLNWATRRLQRGAASLHVIFALFLSFLVFGLLGGLLLYCTEHTVECVVEYPDPARACSNMVECTNSFILEVNTTHCVGLGPDEALAAPVYMMYQLDNYHQNFRPYWSSKSNEQLRGRVMNDPRELSTCHPLIMGQNNRILHPCGAIARTVFNDTYSILTPRGIRIDDSADRIVWPADRRGGTFRNPPPHDVDPDHVDEWLNPQIFPGKIENGHFIVWMRAAALPSFRKLYGIIDRKVTLPIRMLVDSRYPVRSFNGKKSIVFSTQSFLGSRNSFLAIAYLVTAGLSLLFAVFLIF